MKTIQIKFGNKSVEFTDWDQVTLFSAKQHAESISPQEYNELIKRAKSFNKNKVLFTPKTFDKLFSKK